MSLQLIRNILSTIISNKLSTPTGLYISGTYLFWDDVTNAAGYEIYYSTSPGGSKTFHGYSFPPANSIDLSSLPAGDFYLTVRAIASGYESSDYSEECSYTSTPKLSAPTGLSIAAKALTWNAVTHASLYNIYLSYSPGGTREPFDTVATTGVDLSILDGSSSDTFYLTVEATATGYVTSDLSDEIVYNK